MLSFQSRRRCGYVREQIGGGADGSGQKSRYVRIGPLSNGNVQYEHTECKAFRPELSQYDAWLMESANRSLDVRHKKERENVRKRLDKKMKTWKLGLAKGIATAALGVTPHPRDSTTPVTATDSPARGATTAASRGPAVFAKFFSGGVTSDSSPAPLQQKQSSSPATTCKAGATATFASATATGGPAVFAKFFSAADTSNAGSPAPLQAKQSSSNATTCKANPPSKRALSPPKSHKGRPPAGKMWVAGTGWVHDPKFNPAQYAAEQAKKKAVREALGKRGPGRPPKSQHPGHSSIPARAPNAEARGTPADAAVKVDTRAVSTQFIAQHEHLAENYFERRARNVLEMEEPTDVSARQVCQ
jgi:hypothetical protein